ncbi:MAG TPA: SHOCT domain-containing protein [Gaiellaceae bacterium]
MNVFFTVLTALMTGFVIGGAARFAVPGPDPMPFWLTVLIGLVGSAIGTAIGALIFGAQHTFDSSGRSFVTLLLAIGCASGLVAAYRVFVQKRPLTGPDARRFPRTGFGIAKMRRRLHQLGIDPDQIHTVGTASKPEAPAELTHDEVVDQLEKLRDLRERGTITDEEYERARERLRRY